MEFKIFNRHLVSQYEPTGNEILISITDVDDAHFKKDHPQVSSKFRDVCRLRFDDVDRNDIQIVGRGLAVPIKELDAILILSFVANELEFIDTIVVNCEGGLSRSPGVVAGLCNIIEGNDRWVFAMKPYLNKLVYRTILNTENKYNFLKSN